MSIRRRTAVAIATFSACSVTACNAQLASVGSESAGIVTDGGASSSPAPAASGPAPVVTTPCNLMHGEELIIADNLSSPQSLTADATNVYWTNQGDGTIMSLPKAGGVAPTILASGMVHPGNIAVVGATLYWLDVDSMADGSSVLYSLPLGAPATPQKLTALGANATIVHADAARIVVEAESGGPPDLIAVPTDGSAAAEYPAGSNTYYVPVLSDDTNLYWFGPPIPPGPSDGACGVWQRPIADVDGIVSMVGSPLFSSCGPTGESNPNFFPHAQIAVSPSYVVFASTGTASGAGRFVVLPKSGRPASAAFPFPNGAGSAGVNGPGGTGASAVTYDAVSTMAADDLCLYVVGAADFQTTAPLMTGPSQTAIWGLSLDGSGYASLVPAQPIVSLHVEPDALYWTSTENIDGTPGGMIAKLAR